MNSNFKVHKQIYHTYYAIKLGPAKSLKIAGLQHNLQSSTNYDNVTDKLRTAKRIMILQAGCRLPPPSSSLEKSIEMFQNHEGEEKILLDD